MGRACAEESIDAQYQRDGELLAAVGAHQMQALADIERSYERIGRGDFHCRLTAAEAGAVLAVEGMHGALLHGATACVHPGRLVRGLARAVERRGGVIHEGSRVVSFGGAPRSYLETARGRVRAGAIVLAGEAYLSQLRPLRRSVLPVYSYIVLTEPLATDRLAEINWTHRTVVNSRALSVDYLSRTVDGRVLFGGRGAPYHFGSSIAPAYDRDEPTFVRLRASLAAWFPSLAGVRFTHAWGGCLGVPRDFVPIMRFDPASGIATARGYTGEGVAASNLAGRVLADLLTGADSELTSLPMARHGGREWESEPLRFLAARLAQWGAERIDARAARTGTAPTGRTLTERLIGH